MPLSWEEVEPDLAPARFDLRSVPSGLAAGHPDPWAGIDGLRQTLPGTDRLFRRRSGGGTSPAL
jgi:DNA primase